MRSDRISYFRGDSTGELDNVAGAMAAHQVFCTGNPLSESVVSQYSLSKSNEILRNSTSPIITL